MAGKFEKEMEQKLQNFQLQPSLQVWNDIDNVLNSEKSKKRPVLWWILLLGFMLAGTYWMITKIVEKNINTTIKKPIPTNTISTQTKEALKIKVIQTHADKKIFEITQKRHSALQEPAKQKNAFHQVFSVIEKIDLSHITNVELTKPDLIISGSKISPKEIDSSQQLNSSVNNIIQVADTIIQTAKPVTIPNPDPKKISHWFLTSGFGSTNQSSGSINQLFTNSSQVSAAFPPSPIGLGIIPAEKVLTGKNGFHLLAGIGYEEKISRHWAIQLALQYRYLQNNQPTGNKKDSVQTISNAYTADSKAASIPYFYYGGHTQSIQNFAHWLSVPVSFIYSINPKSKNQLQLLIGLTGSWMFSEKWLMADELLQQLYYSKTLTNHLLSNVNAGIRLNIQDKWMIDAMWEQGLTASTKLNNSKKYWNQFSLQINKPITFHNKLLK